MSWTQRVKHPSELYQKGDEVEAVVLNIDTTDGDKPKISLGIKQLIGDPWDRIPFDYPVGKIVTAKVQKVLDFGAFVELEKGIEGLIHVSEISDERVEDPREVLKPGQDVKAEIISIDAAERKIGLSMKAANRSAELAEAQGYSARHAGRHARRRLPQQAEGPAEARQRLASSPSPPWRSDPHSTRCWCSDRSSASASSSSSFSSPHSSKKASRAGAQASARTSASSS